MCENIDDTYGDEDVAVADPGAADTRQVLGLDGRQSEDKRQAF